MVLVKPIRKIKVNKLAWKKTSNSCSNRYLEVQKNKLSKKFRIILKNNSGTIKCKKSSTFEVANETELEPLKEEFKKLTNLLVPILEKFVEQKQQIDVEQIQLILDGMTKRKIHKEKKLLESSLNKSKKLNEEITRSRKEKEKRKKEEKKRKIEKKVIKKLEKEREKIKPKPKPQKRKKIIQDSDDSDGDLIEVTDDSEEEELEDDNITDEESDEEVQENQNDADNLKNNLRLLREDYNVVFTSLQRYERKTNLEAQFASAFNESFKRMIKLTNKMDKFFFSNKKKLASDPKTKRKFEKLFGDFKRTKAQIDQILKHKKIDELKTLSLSSDMSNSRIRKRIQRSGKKNREFSGNSGQSQVQEQGKMVLKFSDEMTINTELEIEKEKQRDLEAMQSTFTEVHDMMKDMKLLVDEQQDFVDDLEDKVENTITHVEKGRVNIRKARGHQKGGLGRVLIKGGMKLF